MDIQQGQLDVPLSEEGVDQAKLLADRFADEPLTGAYSSSLDRSRQTAEIIGQLQDLEVGVEPALRERGLGDFEGEPVAVVRETASRSSA